MCGDSIPRPFRSRAVVIITLKTPCASIKTYKLIIFRRQGKLPKHRHQQRQLVFQVCSRSHFHDATYVFKEQSIPRAARLHSMLTTLLAAGPANACDPHAGRKERAAASPDRTGQHCCLPHDGRQCAVPLGPRVGLRRRRLGPRERRHRTAAGAGHVRLLVGQGAQALAPPSPTSCALLLSYEASEFECSLWWGWDFFGLPTAFISKFLLSRAGTQLDLPRAVDSVVCRPRPRRLGCKSFGICCFRVTVVVLKRRRTPAF